MDLAPLRALVRVSRRNGLRHASARLLDLVALGATCNRGFALCNRADMCSCSAPSPPLRLPRRCLFAGRSVSLARHLPDNEPPAFVAKFARGVVGNSYYDHL